MIIITEDQKKQLDREILKNTHQMQEIEDFPQGIYDSITIEKLDEILQKYGL